MAFQQDWQYLKRQGIFVFRWAYIMRRIDDLRQYTTIPISTNILIESSFFLFLFFFLFAFALWKMAVKYDKRTLKWYIFSFTFSYSFSISFLFCNNMAMQMTTNNERMFRNFNSCIVIWVSFEIEMEIKKHYAVYMW